MDLVEYFGPESSITVRLGESSLVLLAKSISPRPGDQLELAADLDRLHFFPGDERA